MYDIYTMDMDFEQCSVNKKEINLIIPYAVFHFVLSGKGYVNGKEITKDTVFISFKDTRMNYFPSRTDPWSYVYFCLVGPDVEKAFTDHGFELGLSVRSFENSQELFNILSLYQHLAPLDNPDASKLIANAVMLLFENGNKVTPRKSKQQQHTERIKRFIEENYYKKITVEEIAAKFYLNKNYVRTLFSKQLGVSPKQYLQRIRMERAKFLLTNTDESIKYIANSVGYSDTLLFSKMFKKYFTTSPLQYRNEHKCKIQT